LLATTILAAAPADSPGRGISEALARDRAAAIGRLRYDVSFRIPSDPREPVQGRVVVRFTLAAPRAVVLDFGRDEPGWRERVRHVRADGQAIEILYAAGHLTVPAAATKAGENEIAVDFVSGDEALNRNDEFLYTLFVPARAHLAFPCFDQPDLKA